MKDSKNVFKKLGIIGIGLCAACCLLPIGAVTFGVGALTVISAQIEWVGIVAMMIAAISFFIYSIRTRRASSCGLDCGCKNENANQKKGLANGGMVSR